MHRPATSQPLLEQIPLKRFLEMRPDDLRQILAELASSRARRDSPLDPDAIESLIRVIERKGYATVSRLGPEAARLWASRVGLR